MKFTNRMIAMLLCVVMISAVACLSVSALTLLPVGDWVYHEINDYTEVEVYEYNGTKSSVFVPYTNNLIPITTIGSNAFNENTTMQTLTLSKNITTVNSNAFTNCTALETVKFQTVSVKTIDYYAFAGCSALSTIALENTLIDTVSSGVFMNCDALTEITLPATVTSIEDYSFSYCDSLEKIVIPATVTAIDENAFYASNNVVIYCYNDSFAHQYAVDNSIEYVLIDETFDLYVLGDADDDGLVTILDASLVQLVLAQKIEKPEGFDIRADVDTDGSVSIMDATKLQYYVADLLTDTSIGNTFEY